jgi:hypothetical protein
MKKRSKIYENLFTPSKLDYRYSILVTEKSTTTVRRRPNVVFELGFLLLDDPLRHWRKGRKQDNTVAVLFMFCNQDFLRSSKLTIIIYPFQSILSEANKSTNSK